MCLDQLSVLHGFLTGEVSVDFIGVQSKWANENFVNVADEIAVLLIVSNSVWAMTNVDLSIADSSRVDQILNDEKVTQRK